MPFGFGISPQGTIVVSEPGASTVSSYAVSPGTTAGLVTSYRVGHHGSLMPAGTAPAAAGITGAAAS